MKSTQRQLAAARRYRETHKEQRQLYFQRYDVGRRFYQLEKSRRWYHQNRQRIIETKRLDRKKYPEKHHQINQRQYRRKMATPHLRLRHYLSTRINHALKAAGLRKTTTCLKLMGASLEVVKAHIESQFKPGMSWGNRSMWHLDHKRPCASFDLSDLEQQRQCFHYTNLQPLWATENLVKHAKFCDIVVV